MKKVVPNGKVIKELREERTKGALQKEMAPAVHISIRLLRLIENTNHSITIPDLERIASYLGVPKERISGCQSSIGSGPCFMKVHEPIVCRGSETSHAAIHQRELASSCQYLPVRPTSAPARRA